MIVEVSCLLFWFLLSCSHPAAYLLLPLTSFQWLSATSNRTCVSCGKLKWFQGFQLSFNGQCFSLRSVSDLLSLPAVDTCSSWLLLFQKLIACFITNFPHLFIILLSCSLPWWPVKIIIFFVLFITWLHIDNHSLSQDSGVYVYYMIWILLLPSD